VLKSERWAVYAILTLMLIIASFNIIGSLSMLVIEKEKDIAILKTMGMQNNIIQKIFLSTGVLLSMLGAVIGCILALVICLLQQHFGFVKLGSGDSFLIDAYPVKLHVFDFVLVLATVVLIAALASLIPSIKASKKAIELRVK
jgi:lipoprotein-releasing system permease protein